MTCPNRDGTLDTRGCLFCSTGGSGEFAVDFDGLSPRNDSDSGIVKPGMLTSIEMQLQAGILMIAKKLEQKSSHSLNHNKIVPTGADGKDAKAPLPNIIAYFQAYTNTYAPVSYLEQVFTQALSCHQVCGISIATRPDCLPEKVLALLGTLKERFPDKFIWVELGLQTIHQETAKLIRRGYDLNCFERAVNRLQKQDIPVIVHVILGLPGETKTQMLDTVSYLNGAGIFGVKLQLLHVLEDTDLADLYRQGAFEPLTKEDYLEYLVDCLEHLSPEIVVHRVTGDGPKRILLAPAWSGNKKDVLNSLHRLMRQQGARQGRLFTE